MEPEDLSSCSQEATTGPYAKPDESGPHLHILLSVIHFNIILSFVPSIISGVFPSSYPIKIEYAFLISGWHNVRKASVGDDAKKVTWL
jgi:hypothetical protein